MKMLMRYVVYKRVSRKSQEISGLGLEAQEAAVQQYLRPGDEVVASFIEVESGRNNLRPKLQQALLACKDLKATLLVSKIDRLSRDCKFLFSILDSEVPIRACDFPEANELTIKIMAVIAEWEVKRIQTRIKEALAAKRARGESLGNAKNLTGQKAGQEANRQKFLDRVKPMRSLILHFVKEGKTNAEIFILMPKFDPSFTRPFGDRAVKYLRKEFEQTQ